MNQKHPTTGDTPPKNPPNLRKAAHTWYKTREQIRCAETGAESVSASNKHSEAIRKLAGVVEFDLRTGGQEP